MAWQMQWHPMKWLEVKDVDKGFCCGSVRFYFPLSYLPRWLLWLWSPCCRFRCICTNALQSRYYKWEELRYQLTRPTVGSAEMSLHLGQALGSSHLKGSEVLNPQLRYASWNHKYWWILEYKLPELQFIEIFSQNNTWRRMYSWRGWP